MGSGGSYHRQVVLHWNAASSTNSENTNGANVTRRPWSASRRLLPQHSTLEEMLSSAQKAPYRT
ncbi:hypothetical protein DPMN_148785 [Dreissena polymorpha]|uniref:Uncharacterized protein n=1 Tax=Dreissena polymorpha TaxID=45954 RepID=A0A9D4FBK4_DREPO|nr:hypothetical protein DPMN_148785 [Dreissena polymorpha]